MLMMSGVYEQDSNVTQLGNFKLFTTQEKKWKHKLSIWFDKSGLKSGGHIRPGPDLKNGRIPAGAGYDIRCNPKIFPPACI